MKEDYQKALEKLTLFFLSNPVPFNGQSYQKEKGPGTSDQSLFRLQNKFRKIPLLSDQVWGRNIKQFLVISKIISVDLCQPVHHIKNYFTFICPFEYGKFGKGKNYKNLNISRTKSFLDETKNIFHSFWRAIIWWNNKRLIKNSRHKLCLNSAMETLEQ